MIKIDGKAYSQKLQEEMREEHERLMEKCGRRAGLSVIMVGENPASKVYVQNKIKACEKVGFYSEIQFFPEDITEEEVLLEIENLNRDENIDGILVQLPLPKHIDERKVTEKIAVQKDVDGFHPENIGKMMIGDDSAFLSCTPYGIMQLLNEYDIDLLGKDVVIVGRSNIVGKPMALMLIGRGATVTVCNSKTKNLSEKLRGADIVIAAAGVAKLVKAEDVKDGVVVIDVGINRVDGKLCGDVDFEAVSAKASYITPVPGGVGPMTIASLLKNTLKSYKRKIEHI